MAIPGLAAAAGSSVVDWAKNFARGKGLLGSDANEAAVEERRRRIWQPPLENPALQYLEEKGSNSGLTPQLQYATPPLQERWEDQGRSRPSIPTEMIRGIAGEQYLGDPASPFRYRGL